MTKFNRKTKIVNRTTNLAGGRAYVQTPKTEFVSILLTSFANDQFYRTENETLEKVSALLDSIDSKFAAKTAIYARKTFGMRSISHVVAAEIANRVKGQEWTKNFYMKVIKRPDDITEILSYYMNKFGKPVPNSLKKGLGRSFGAFDEYQIAKYRGERNEISLVDAVNLVHPKLKGKAALAIKKLVADKLRSVDTWEAQISAAGKSKDSEKAKAKAWAGLIKEKKIGYFALLKNLRNVLEQSPEVLADALKLLADEKLIKNSLVLPFRFSTALREIEDTNLDGAGKVLVALNKAIDISLSNVPVLPGRTLVVLDHSGSMDGKPAEIGSLFASVLVKTNDADFMMFSDEAKYKTVNPADSLITIAHSMLRSMKSGGTNFNSIFDEANKPYDRIIILSDMQGWMGNSGYGYGSPDVSFKDYKVRTGADPIIYSFDLQGYGTLQFPEKRVFELAGFSDKIFDIMKLLESDKDALVNEIEKIEL